MNNILSDEGMENIKKEWPALQEGLNRLCGEMIEDYGALVATVASLKKEKIKLAKDAVFVIDGYKKEIAELKKDNGQLEKKYTSTMKGWKQVLADYSALITVNEKKTKNDRRKRDAGYPLRAPERRGV